MMPKADQAWLDANITAIGGGHGLGRLLSALIDKGDKLTGIVTTTDNGGSTGRLRHTQGCIAWGDIRNCINQLVKTPSTGSRLFEYRFSGEGELAGHNLGNLMLLALDQLCIRPLDAIGLIKEMLDIDINLLPMSETPCDLQATVGGNTLVFGEVAVDQLGEFPQSLSLAPKVEAVAEARAAIARADLILLGPGSFLTSIMPPLLLKDIQQAIASSSAPCLYINNLVKEDSPAATRNLIEKIAWIEDLTNIRIDAVLTALDDQQSYPWPAFRLCCADADNDYYHSRSSLKAAVYQVFQQLVTSRS